MSSDKSTATASRGTVRNWTEAEKDVVWEQACLAKEENLPLTEAFRRVVKLLPHRSEAAVGMLYYNVLRKEREEEEILPKKSKATTVTTPEFKVDTRLLEAFQGLPEYMQELNNKIDKLEERLENPDPIAIITALSQLVAHQTNHEDYSTELKSLQEENQALRQNIEKLTRSYEDALGIYDMFTNMASISQIMSLGDFKQEMKTTLDKWGNVLNISFDRSINE